MEVSHCSSTILSGHMWTTPKFQIYPTTDQQPSQQNASSVNNFSHFKYIKFARHTQNKECKKYEIYELIFVGLAIPMGEKEPKKNSFPVHVHFNNEHKHLCDICLDEDYYHLKMMIISTNRSIIAYNWVVQNREEEESWSDTMAWMCLGHKKS